MNNSETISSNLSMIAPPHRELLNQFSELTLEENESVLNVPRNQKNIVIVKSGGLKQQISTSSGNKIVLDILKPGEQAGLINKYTDFSSMRVTAPESTTVYIGSIEQFSMAKQIDFAWYMKGLRQIQLRLNELWERFHTKTRYNMRTLLICQLCKLSKKFGLPRDDGIVFTNWLELQNIAEMTGNCRESIYRSFARLKAENLVRTKDRLCIPDLKRLRNHSETNCNFCTTHGSKQDRQGTGTVQ